MSVEGHVSSFTLSDGILACLTSEWYACGFMALVGGGGRREDQSRGKGKRGRRGERETEWGEREGGRGGIQGAKLSSVGIISF